MENDARNGIFLIALSLFLLPVMMDLMQHHDDASDEYERECDVNYRILVLDNNDPIDPAPVSYTHLTLPTTPYV